ncbi:hypothetical protein Q4610_16200 [Sphingobium sp. HBC34]|uniref:Uncharacterized protein n=2 Tax=Sphingobium cyanobacteriorum TaxID=3063954 RepID=A0ABT8ZRK9_9SPHN|nr:hypothetical protein [Sphingobium sp. HBC34]
MMMVPVGGEAATPVSQTPPADPKDSPEEIARDSARDLNGSRFYNKPGATRADYDAAWQDCRLIARGSRTPSGTVPYYYNPAVISPLAAGVGAGLGGLIAGAIIEGEQRRANRRNCLLIRGWRQVELPAQEAARVAALGEADRNSYFNGIVGATEVQGEVTTRTSFTPPNDPSFALDGPLAGPSTLFLGKKVDPTVPFVLAPGEGAVVIAYRRSIKPFSGHAFVQFARYDPAGRDLVYQPKDWKKKGDKTTYLTVADSSKGKAPYEVQVVRLTAGDYVISDTGLMLPMGGSNCFGAPTFHVAEGDVAYIGDFIPVAGARTADGTKFSGTAYAFHPEDARQALAGQQADLAKALKPAKILNAATYACSGTVMTRWDMPGADVVTQIAAPPAVPMPDVPMPAAPMPAAPMPDGPVAPAS